MGVRQRLGMVPALLTGQRCAMPACLTRGAAGTSLKDGSIRSQASRRLRVRLSVERQGRCGSRPLTAALGEEAPVQRPACLRSRNAVADTQASHVVEPTTRGAVNPALTRSNQRSHTPKGLADAAPHLALL